MAANQTLTIDLLTPAGSLQDADGKPFASGVEVPGVEIPGALGELGVLPDHVPFLTPVLPGVVRFKMNEESHRVAVGAGFLEVSADGRVTILVDKAVRPADVDAAAVKRDLEDAAKRLGELKDATDSAEHRRLSGEVAWYEAQLRAAQG